MPAHSADLNRALYSLRDHLVRARNRNGGGPVRLSPESVDRLNLLPAALMRLTTAEKERERDAAASPPASPVVSESSPRAESRSAPPENRSESDDPELASRGIEVLHPEGETKRDKLNNLFRLARACEACRGLGTLRDQMVFAVGDPDADIMFVGEAPGAEEEKQKEPFVGPAGQKLTSIIKAMGLGREDVYISNIVKFRPMMGDGRFQGPKNRKPTPGEMAAAVKYVMAEIDVVRPRVIVACGGTAAEGLLDLSGSVSRMRNRFYELKGIPVMVTYHPSYILRAESDADGGRSKKRMVWEDMLQVMEKAGLPVSEKQRGYFS